MLSRQPLPLDYEKEMGETHDSVLCCLHSPSAPGSSCGISEVVFSFMKTHLPNRNYWRYNYIRFCGIHILSMKLFSLGYIVMCVCVPGELASDTSVFIPCSWRHPPSSPLHSNCQCQPRYYSLCQCVLEWVVWWWWWFVQGRRQPTCRQHCAADQNHLWVYTTTNWWCSSYTIVILQGTPTGDETNCEFDHM